MKGKSKILLVMLTLLFVVAMSFSAYGADGQIKITQPDSFPVVIDQPGSYVLTSNITLSTDANGIVIDASNVTLDLNGHAIIGPGSGSGNGIYTYGKHNITIKNGTVRDFGGSGIDFAGFYLPTNVPNFRVEDITAILNGGHGIEASRSTITNCTARYNGNYGIGGSYSTITNCTATHNGSHGINATSSTVKDCTAYSNGEDGIYATSSTITDFTANSNSLKGIEAVESTVTNCVANKNKGDGMKVSYCTVRNCTMFDNEGTGIYVIDRCRIEGNNLRENWSYELKVSGIWNYVIKNVVSGGHCGANFSIDSPLLNYVPRAGLDGDNGNYEFCSDF